MKRLALLIAFLTYLPFAAAQTLLVFGGDGFGPFAYARNGQADGIFPRILRRAAEISGDSYEIQLMPWGRAYLRAERGEGGIFGLSHTDARSKLFDYSQPIYDNDVLIVTLASKPLAFKSLADLKGKVLGGIMAGSYGDEIDAALAAGMFSIERDSNAEQRMAKLLHGRIDAALVDGGQIGLESALGSASVRANRDKFHVVSTPLVHDPLHLAFPKSLAKRAAIDRFNAALARMKKSGELRAFFAEALKGGQ